MGIDGNACRHQLHPQSLATLRYKCYLFWHSQIGRGKEQLVGCHICLVHKFGKPTTCKSSNQKRKGESLYSIAFFSRAPDLIILLRSLYDAFWSMEATCDPHMAQKMPWMHPVGTSTHIQEVVGSESKINQWVPNPQMRRAHCIAENSVMKLNRRYTDQFLHFTLWKKLVFCAGD